MSRLTPLILYIFDKDFMLVIIKTTYCNVHTTLNQYWKLADLKNSVHASHAAHGLWVRPHCSVLNFFSIRCTVFTFTCIGEFGLHSNLGKQSYLDCFNGQSGENVHTTLLRLGILKTYGRLVVRVALAPAKTRLVLSWQGTYCNRTQCWAPCIGSYIGSQTGKPGELITYIWSSTHFFRKLSHLDPP